jgi:hypothetical protein
MMLWGIGFSPGFPKVSLNCSCNFILFMYVLVSALLSFLHLVSEITEIGYLFQYWFLIYSSSVCFMLHISIYLVLTTEILVLFFFFCSLLYLKCFSTTQNLHCALMLQWFKMEQDHFWELLIFHLVELFLPVRIYSCILYNYCVSMAMT